MSNIMDDQQDILPEEPDGGHGYEPGTAETKNENDTGSGKKQVADKGKSDKKPMNKMVKIAGITVAVIAASVAFVAFDMSRQQHTAPKADNQAMSLDDVAQQKPSDAPAKVVADAPQQTINGVTTAPLPSANVPVTAMQPDIKPAAANQPTDNRLAMVESRLDRIEEYLSSLSKERSSAKQKKPDQKVKVTDKAKPDPVTKKVAIALPAPIAATIAQQAEWVDVVDKPVQAEPKASCSYRGGINNRAWVDCDGTIHSVRRGDYLPSPYGMVSGVNDQSGSVSTAGGVIQ